MTEIPGLLDGESDWVFNELATAHILFEGNEYSDLQFSNIQILDLDLVKDPTVGYDMIKRTLEPLSIKGVVFRSLDGKKLAKVLKEEFNYGKVNEQSSRGIGKALSSLFKRKNNDRKA